jgi:hypothetical protein
MPGALLTVSHVSKKMLFLRATTPQSDQLQALRGGDGWPSTWHAIALKLPAAQIRSCRDQGNSRKLRLKRQIRHTVSAGTVGGEAKAIQIISTAGNVDGGAKVIRQKWWCISASQQLACWCPCPLTVTCEFIIEETCLHQ